MVKFTCECVLQMPAHVYVIERDTAAFRSLYAQAMHMGTLEVIGEEVQGSTVMVHTRCFPEKDKFVPGPLQRFVRDDIIHQEKWYYDAEKLKQPPYEISFRQIPPLVGDNADVTGTVRIEVVTATTCRQTLECTANVKPIFNVPGTGHIAARGIEDNLKKAYRLLPQVVEKWLVTRQVLLDDAQSASAMWDGDVALKHLSQNVLANIRNPPETLVHQLGQKLAQQPLGSLVRIQKPLSRSRLCTVTGDDTQTLYDDARSQFSCAPSAIDSVTTSSFKNLPSFENRERGCKYAKLNTSREVVFYDAVEYFYFEEGDESTGLTELGVLRASGSKVERQPGLLGGVHDTAKFVKAAQAWSNFWSRLGVEVELDDTKPQRRVLMNARAVLLGAVVAGAVGMGLGVLIAASAFKGKPRGSPSGQSRRKHPKGNKKDEGEVVKEGEGDSVAEDMKKDARFNIQDHEAVGGTASAPQLATVPSASLVPWLSDPAQVSADPTDPNRPSWGTGHFLSPRMILSGRKDRQVLTQEISWT